MMAAMMRVAPPGVGALAKELLQALILLVFTVAHGGNK